MKKLIFAMITLACMSGQACDQTSESFILVHGIAGHAGHFGKLAETIEAKVECAKAYHFEYETSNSELKVPDFAKQLDQFLAQIPQGSFAKDLNLIGHSQGGLISLEWILQNYKSQTGQIQRLNRYMTLSTPFWGSDFAAMGSSLFFPLGLEKNFISPAGRNQLEDMKYGSFQSFVNLNRVIAAKNYIANNIQVLNVAAMAPLPMSWLKDSSSQFFEGDIVVNIPSMKLDSIMAIDHNYDYQSSEIIESVTIETDIANEAHTIGMHLDLIPGDGENFHGVAETPKDCITEDKCSNPSTVALLDYINNKSVQDNSDLTEVIKGFELKVNVQLPVGFDTELTVIKVLNEEDSVELSNYRLDGKEKESISEFMGTSTVLIKGSIMQADPDLDLILQIEHPLLKTKKVKVKVRKGVTTLLSTGLS